MSIRICRDSAARRGIPLPPSRSPAGPGSRATGRYAFRIYSLKNLTALPAHILDFSAAGALAEILSISGREFGHSFSMCGKSVANMIWSTPTLVTLLDRDPFVLHGEIDVFTDIGRRQ